MTDGASLALFLILLRLAEGMRFNIQENAMTEIALFIAQTRSKTV